MSALLLNTVSLIIKRGWWWVIKKEKKYSTEHRHGPNQGTQYGPLTNNVVVPTKKCIWNISFWSAFFLLVVVIIIILP